MIQKPKGTKDLLPKDTALWQYVESKINNILKNYGFKEIRVPVFEHTELFLRGVGETTDVVQKEMYTFEDKGGRSITLRPEGTAGVIRAYLENGLSSQPTPIKLSYNITAYRYENVQKGRYREFNQIGAEIIGTASYQADIELILLAKAIIEGLNIKNTVLEINNIGCPICRQEYQNELKKYIMNNISEYCFECKERLEKNPMRILDCKNQKCAKFNENAPIITNYLCLECQTHFESLKNALDKIGCEYKINPKTVRGLDYYTKTVFEFIDSVDNYALLGGGRYDGLVEQLDGVSTPAIGFALGLERLIETYSKYNEKIEVSTPEIFFVSIGESADEYITQLVQNLRKQGKYVEKDICGRSVNAQFKYASKIKAQYVVTIGDEELKTKIGKIKNMDTGEEQEYKLI